MTQTVKQQANKSAYQHKDLYQQVTDTIIAQLEAGTIPWEKPWTGEDTRLLELPKNVTSGKTYRGINILLLWSATISKGLISPEWSTFRQWQEKKEAIRKGEKGTMIVYYDIMEKEQDGEIKKIPFLKQSVVFNRCQLASYTPEEVTERSEKSSLVERIEAVDAFFANTKAIVEHHDGGACYIPSLDKIKMPHPASFIDTTTCTATENYYATLAHEFIHLTGSSKRLNRKFGKKYGDEYYAGEELVAELGAAFLSAKFDISTPERKDHAAYIASWLKSLKEDKRVIFTAASEASKALDYLQGLQPTP